MTGRSHEVMLKTKEWTIFLANDHYRYMIFHNSPDCQSWSTHSGRIVRDNCRMCGVKIPDKITLFHGVLSKL